jgi:hypothetical protein
VQPDATITATPFVYLTFSPGSVVPRPSAVNVGRSRSPTPGSPQPQDVTTILSSLSANDTSESWLIVTPSPGCRITTTTQRPHDR